MVRAASAALTRPWSAALAVAASVAIFGGPSAGATRPASKAPAFSAPSVIPSWHLMYDSDDQVWRVPMSRRLIALTFDDGPYPFYTPLLLHVLDRSHVAATFFCVGRSAQQFPELIDRIIASGDEIGNHTFNHYALKGLSDEQIAEQIMEGGAILSTFVGRPIDLFRPPHGRYDKHVLEIAAAMGYRTVFWSDSPEDTKNISPALEVQRVLAQAYPGGIVLLHSGEYRTIEALPVIIERLRARGFTFVTVDQLLASGNF
jgi:peptidoglycan/xylan/chitin deacetylase (PgdA/CDA1 family)